MWPMYVCMSVVLWCMFKSITIYAIACSEYSSFYISNLSLWLHPWAFNPSNYHGYSFLFPSKLILLPMESNLPDLCHYTEHLMFSDHYRCHTGYCPPIISTSAHSNFCHHVCNILTTGYVHYQAYWFTNYMKYSFSSALTRVLMCYISFKYCPYKYMMDMR